LTEINAIECNNFLRIRINQAAKNEACTAVFVLVIITQGHKAFTALLG